MGTVTNMQRRAEKRLDNANCREAIRDRFEVMDSHAAISARIRQLRGLGVVIVSREHNPKRGTTGPHEYRMIASEGGGSGAA